MNTRTIEKITIVVSVVVLGVALAVSVRSAPAAPLVVALVVTVSAGLDLVLRGEARYRPTPDLFILPAALVVGAVLFLSLLASGPSIVIGLAVFGILLFVVFWAEHGLRLGLMDARAGETALTAVGYLAAFALYAAIYQSKTRSLVSAPAIIAITMLLATRQLRLTQMAVTPSAPGSGPPVAGMGAAGGDRVGRTAGAVSGGSGPSVESATQPAAATLARSSTRRRDSEIVSSLQPALSAQRRALWPGWPRTLLYSAVVALAAGEVTWALNYWPLNGLLGGAFLLSVFYFLVGIFSHHLQDRLTRRLLLEYGSVALAGIVVTAVAGLLRRAA